MIEKLKIWVRKIKVDLVAVYLASRDVRTPRVAKFLAVALAAYALSPIDLIPDFIPILGYLDDLILVPAGIALVVKFIPDSLMREFRVNAAQRTYPSKNWIMGILIIAFWLICVLFIGLWALALF